MAMNMKSAWSLATAGMTTMMSAREKVSNFSLKRSHITTAFVRLRVDYIRQNRRQWKFYIKS